MLSSIFLDVEYRIMSEIEKNKNISQRELAKRLGISLGRTNILIGKMVKAGQIKIEQTSPKAVAYMITSVGVMEKLKKTLQYIKIHYIELYHTKEKVKETIKKILELHDVIFVLLTEPEIGEIVRMASEEIEHKKNIIFVYEISEDMFNKYDNPALLHMLVDNKKICKLTFYRNLTLYNIIDKI